MKRAIALFLILVSFAGGSYAGYLTPLGTGVAIEKYHVHGGGGITLWVSGINNPDGCGDTHLVHVPPTLAGYKTMVAAAMEAHALNKKIGLHASSCATIPFWGGSVTYPIVTDVWVTD